MRTFSFLFLILLMGFSGCDFFSSEQAPGTVTLQLNHEVDGTTMQRNSSFYTNEAGVNYRVTLLEYILSEINLVNEAGEKVLLKEFHYVNDATASSKTLSNISVPGGKYKSLTFTFGTTNANSPNIPNTLEFQGMAWPPQMAGGTAGLYHNMRLEGQYQVNNEPDVLASFLTHTGPTGGTDNSVTYTLPINLNVDGKANLLSLTMNINNWFANPNTYQFLDYNPPMIMGNPTAQSLLKQNSADVFTASLQ